MDGDNNIVVKLRLVKKQLRYEAYTHIDGKKVPLSVDVSD